MFFQPSYPLSVEGEPYMFTPATGEGAGVKARDTEAHRNVFSGQGWGTNGFCSFTPLPLSPVISLTPGPLHTRPGDLSTLCVSRMPPPPCSLPWTGANGESTGLLLPPRTPPLPEPPTPLRQVGTWDPLLQCLSLDTPLLEQQNTKKRYRTKNNCGQAQWAQILDKRYKESKKPNCTFEDLEAKAGDGEHRAGYCTPPCTQHHLK